MKDIHLKYNSFAEVLKNKFGTRVYRVTLHAGLTCPNRDGTKGFGGCCYCHDENLLGKSWHKQLPIREQVCFGMNYIQERHNAEKYLVYFQNATNTYAPLDILRKNFSDALSFPDIVGIIIGTRADCLETPVLELLSEINEKTYLWVDVGLQSHRDETLRKINRGHDIKTYITAIENLAKRKILNCSHVILGLPGETREQILEGSNFINQLPVNGIKIHNLVVTKDTPLADWYSRKEYAPMSLYSYASLCVDYLEHLRKDIVIHRLNAHAPARLTLAPKWSINKLATLNSIHQEIIKRNSWQGKKC